MPPLTERSVSVVIPTQDGTSTIERALESVRGNLPCIRETLVVTSRSPDPYRAFLEREIAPRFKDIGLIILDSGPTSNGSIARNVGIVAARADFVAFLDDDDEWLVGKLPVYFDAMQDRALDGNFVVFSTVIACDERREVKKLMPTHKYDGGNIGEFVLGFGGGAQTSSLLLPSRLAKKVQFNPTLIRHQDYDFCLRLQEAGATFHQIEQPLSYWYQRGSIVAKGGTFDFCESWMKANRHRLSNRAVVGYVGKELFAAARRERRMSAFARLSWTELGLGQRLQLLRDLSIRLFAYGARITARRFHILSNSRS